jgi:outer membrane protein assembly factor BamB
VRNVLWRLLLAFSCVAGSGLAFGAGAAAAATSDDTSAVAYQQDPAHDGDSTDSSFAAPLTKAWSATLPGDVYYPLIVGDKVFVDYADAAGGTDVEALSLSSGDKVWGPVAIGGRYSFGAIAYDDGQVFALNYSGTLSAFDAQTGDLSWSKALPGQSAFTSPPTATGGTVYVSGAGSGGTVYAVDESDGTVKWTAPVENGDHSSPAVDDSGVYVSYACEQAYSFSFAGALRWHHSTDCDGGGGRTDVLHDGRDYVRDDAGMTPAVLSGDDGTAVSAFTSATAPAFDGSTMVTLADGTLTATNLSTGHALWSKASDFTIAPIIVNGYVVDGTSSGTIMALDEMTGEVLWQGNAGAAISAPDEHNAEGLVGLAEAEGDLAVPASQRLVVFASPTDGVARITAGPANGSFVGSAATFTFTSNDADASYQCSLDGTSVGCTSPFAVQNLSEGQHTFSVSVDGSSIAASRTFTADRTAPTVEQPTVSSPFSTAPTDDFTWSATDAGSGVASYAVRWQKITDRGSVGGWHHPAALASLTAVSAQLPVGQRHTLCVSVRARDNVGNTSAWSAARCVAGLTDDRDFRASGGWFRGTAADDFDRTFTGTKHHGAALKLRHLRARQIAVKALVCPDCGALQVRFGSLHERLALRSPSITGMHLFVLPAMSKVTRGTLTLTAASRHHNVEVDAVGVFSAKS